MSASQKCEIIFSGDASGIVTAAGQTRQSLEGVKQETKKATDATKEQSDTFLKAGSTAAGFKATLAQLGQEIPVLGMIGRAGLNPLAVALMAIGGAFAYVKRETEEEIKALDALGESSSRGFGNMKEAMRIASEEIARSWQAFDDWEKHIADDNQKIDKNLASEVSRLNEIYAAVTKITEAKKAAAMASIDSDAAMTPEQKAAAKADVESSTAKAEQFNAAQKRADVIAAQSKAIEDKKAQEAIDKTAAEKAQAEAQDPVRKARIKDLPDRAAAIAKYNKEFVEGSAKERFQAEEELKIAKLNYAAKKDLADKAPNPRNDEALAEAERYLGEANRDVNRFVAADAVAKRAKDSALKRASDLAQEQDQKDKDAERAKTKYDQTKTTRIAMEEELARLQASAEIQNKSDAEVAAVNSRAAASKFIGDATQTPTGRVLVEAGQAAHKTPGARTEEDNAVIATAEQIARNNGLNAQAVMQALSQGAGNDELFAAGLKAVLIRLSKVEAQVSGSYNHPH